MRQTFGKLKSGNDFTPEFVYLSSMVVGLSLLFDIWYGKTPLKHFFDLVVNKEVWVVDYEKERFRHRAAGTSFGRIFLTGI